MSWNVVARALLVVCIAGAGAASAWAATIHGTQHADVIRVGAPPPPRTTTAATTTTTTATTTTAPASNAQPGHYCGFTNNGDAICFDVTGGTPQTFTNLKFTITYRGTDCNPTATGTVDYTTGGVAQLQPDNSFDFEVASGAQAGTFAKGTVAPDGTATGVLNVRSVLSSSGTTYTCGLTTDWTATKQ